MDILKLSKSLASADKDIRYAALSVIQSRWLEIHRSSYKKICYGLFFLYWHGDDVDRQLKDSQSICDLMIPLSNSNFMAFCLSMLEVMKKLWHRIDYDRIDKFLKFTKNFFKSVYKKLNSLKSKATFKYWNNYLSCRLFVDSKGFINS